MPVVIMPHPDFAAALTKQNRPLPAPVNGMALLDTGAGGTSVDEQIAIKMGLVPVGPGQITSATHQKQPCLVYPIHLEFPGGNLKIDVTRAAGLPLAAEGISVLIGRDVLSRCVMIYHGPDGSVTLSF
jgi:predicted aspartyl protease